MEKFGTGVVPINQKVLKVYWKKKNQSLFGLWEALMNTGYFDCYSISPIREKLLFKGMKKEILYIY